jgi:oligosaccharyltransferase complex subunit alpha (ribophorin I)
LWKKLLVLIGLYDRNVTFWTDYPSSSSFLRNTTEIRRSFMDTVGRPTLKLTTFNVADDLRDGADLVVEYDYPWLNTYRKPAVVAVSILAVFTVSWVLRGLDLTIGTGGEKR